MKLLGLAEFDTGRRKLTGGSLVASFRNYVDISSRSDFAATDFIYPAGGVFRVGEVGVAGTNDVFFQACPATASGFGYLEAWISAGLVLGTGGNGDKPIIIRPNRTEVARFDTTNGLTMASKQIKTVADPTLAQDAATKNYVDTTVAVPSWTAPTLLNSWVNFDTSLYNAAGYRKSTLTGTVTLRGLVKSGSSGSAIIFTLPSGFRPPKTYLLPAASSLGYAEVRIDTSGNVWAQTGGSTVYTSLDGITFELT